MPNSFAFFIDIVKMSKWGLNKCDDDSDASSLKSSYHVHGGLLLYSFYAIIGFTPSSLMHKEKKSS